MQPPQITRGSRCALKHLLLIPTHAGEDRPGSLRPRRGPAGSTQRRWFWFQSLTQFQEFIRQNFKDADERQQTLRLELAAKGGSADSRGFWRF